MGLVEVWWWLVVGLWRMASRSVVVAGCGFVDVGLWLWDCGGGKCGVVGLWRMAG